MSDSRFFTGWTKLCNIVAEIKNSNPFHRGVILRTIFLLGNCPHWIQQGYLDRISDLIQKTVNEFSLVRAYKNLKAKEMVIYFNKIIENILSNFIPLVMTETHTR